VRQWERTGGCGCVKGCIVVPYQGDKTEECGMGAECGACGREVHVGFW
jgi:hypothetical protein